MFQFKQFTIHQDRTPMKVGTDGVLLGAWARVEQANRILDIGTGTGLLALMAAQRNDTAIIDAIEIESNAYQQAKENIQAVHWRERISVFFQALQNYNPPYHFDCILCNPPFFKKSTKAPNIGRTLARHNDTLPFSELMEHAARLLIPQGIFCIILPVKEAQECIALGKKHHLFPQYITQVRPNLDKPVKRHLIQFGFQEKSIITDELIIEYKRHQYSPKYEELTKAFYLK